MFPYAPRTLTDADPARWTVHKAKARRGDGRYRCLPVAVAVIGLVAAACDGGSASGDPTPTPTVTVTETVSPTPASPSPDPVGDDACSALVGGDQLAFVFVTSPSPGEQVSTGFTVEGCSNAFEAAHEWRLLDRDGFPIADGFGTASCGTGCVGTFSFTVDYLVQERQVGSLQVFTTSPQDGSVQDLNTIPLVLEP